MEISIFDSSCRAYFPLVPVEISIIVPVLNEAPIIRSCLTQLRLRAAEAEIIIADGGSSDGTGELAADLCDEVITTKRGRAVQMNAGARVAHGAILWFLHADVEVPTDCLEEISRALSDPEVAGGYFRIRLPRDRFVYRFTDGFAHYAGCLLRMRCGDHGIFCRRDIFEKLGGFPEVPLMEDVEFFRAMHHRGRVRAVHRRLLVSPRRYEAVGPARLIFAYGIIATFYVLGFPSRTLASLYRRMCCRDS